MYASLPDRIRSQADRAYRQFRRDPSHPGLNFKKVDREDNIYSARIGIRNEALGRMDNEETV